MEVNGADHFNTHAVVGGGKARALRIKQDAGLMRNLTIALYQYPLFAALRETICNAHDAHIKWGVKAPIEITVNDDEVVIQDKGKGIPPDEMEDRYGVYGESDKKEDENQTGGFGLGCKSPMAYATNFTVETRHNSVLSIWNMSRGSADTDGMPDIREIVRVPCEKKEHGLTVRIPIVALGDRDKIMRHVRDLVYVGDIKARLNQKKLPTYPYKDSDLPFMLIEDARLPDYLQPTPVNHSYSNNGRRANTYNSFVKLGAVLYPIPEEVKEQFNIFGRSSDASMIPQGYSVVLLAKGGTINMTPSRESLNLTSLTLDTLAVLTKQCKEIINEMKVPMIDGAAKLLASSVQITNLEDRDELIKAYFALSKGFLTILQNQRSSVYFHDKANKQANTKAEMIALGAEWMVRNNRYEETIAKIIEAQAGNVEDMKELIWNKLWEKYSRYYPKQLHMMKKLPYRDKSSLSIKRLMLYENYQRFTRWINFLKGLENANEVYFSYNDYSNQQESLDEVIKAFERVNQQGYYRYSHDSASRIINHRTEPLAKDFPIVLAQSEASLNRVRKTHKEFPSVAFRIIARKKADYDALVTLLLGKLKCANLFLCRDFDVLPKKQVQLQKLTVYEPEEDRHTRYLEDGEDVPFYSYLPAEGLILGEHYSHPRNRIKLKWEHATMRAVAQVYPKTVLCGSADEARLLEDQGKTNILLDLSKRFEEWMNTDPVAMQAILPRMSNISRFGVSHRLSTILQLLSPAEVFEVLGLEPDHGTEAQILPPVAHAFLRVSGEGNHPVCGIQYVHQAANRVSKKIANYFGRDLQSILDVSSVGKLLSDIPYRTVTKATEENAPVRSLYRSAIVAALQTARVHHALCEMERDQE